MPKGQYDRRTAATRRYTDLNRWTANEWANLHPESGCEISPAPYGCLTCPLPHCKYDNADPKYSRRYLTGIRDIALVRQYESMVEPDRSNSKLVVSTLAAQEHHSMRNIWFRLNNGRWWRTELNWDGEGLQIQE
tara:strand:- start:793 stop:1194 length:402 start_codon:yes stop_codon:yes gene_type:complete